MKTQNKAGLAPEFQTKDAKKGMSFEKKLLICLGGACVIMVLVLLAMDAYGARRQRFQSALYPYSITYYTGTFEYNQVLLGAAEGESTYMERFDAKNAEEEYYISIVSIDPQESLDDVLEAFQSDGDYSFNVEEDVTFGKEDYTATRITYIDESGAVPAEVSYYYMLDRELLITTCTDAQHKAEIEEMLKSVEFR